MFKPGDIARIKSSKTEIGIAIINSDSALVTYDDGRQQPARKWVALTELEAPMEPVNYGPREHWLFS